MTIIEHAANGLATLENLRRMIQTAEHTENQFGCLDHAIREFRKIEMEAADAALSLAMNRQLTTEQFYLLRYLGVLTCSDNLEYTVYLRNFEEGTFRIARNVQCDAAMAMFRPSGSDGKPGKIDSDIPEFSSSLIKSI